LLAPTDGDGLSAFEYFALAIKRVSSDQNHCGVLYQAPDGSTWIIHLAWNYKLRSGLVPQDYYWQPTALDESNQKLLAVLAERVRTADPAIPYGLNAEGVSFDGESGAIDVSRSGKGLTCAVFILALLRTHGLNLLAEGEWPTDANIEWQERIVAALREKSPEHAAAVQADIGCARFSPGEVVGASAIAEWPVSFADAAAAALEIEAQLPPLAA
jgi:hypothetical protein